MVHNGLAHFSDPNAEIITLTGHDISPTQSFMTIDATHTMVTITDPWNINIGNYTVSISCEDPYSDIGTGTVTMDFIVEITENVG